MDSHYQESPENSQADNLTCGSLKLQHPQMDSRSKQIIYLTAFVLNSGHEQLSAIINYTRTPNFIDVKI